MRALLIAVLFSLTACGSEPTSRGTLERGTTAVHAVLHAGSDTAFVLFTTVPPDLRRTRSSGVPGLRVRLLHSGQAVTLSEAPPGYPDCVRNDYSFSQAPAEKGCYAARLPEAIRSGGQYELLAELPGGREVRGRAVVPEAPTMHTPTDGARITVRHDPTIRGDGEWTAEVPVRWHPEEGNAVFDVNLVIDVAFRDGEKRSEACRISGSGSRATPAHSGTYVLRDIDCLRGTHPVPWDSLHARVLVTALDTAYARYTDEVFRRGSVRLDRASAGVHGALGLFSAAATAEREITLLPGNR